MYENSLNTQLVQMNHFRSRHFNWTLFFICWLVRRSGNHWRRLHRAQGTRVPTFTNGWARMRHE